MSQVPPIGRNEVTKTLFDYLRAEMTAGGVLVGRGVAPQDGGWSGGEPGQGTWVNYVVLRTGKAVSPAPGEPERLGARRTSWLLTYQLAYHGTRESLADELGDRVRAAVVNFSGPVTAAGVEWTVQSIVIPELGGSTRDDTTEPAHWSITDPVSLHLSRSTIR